jgi:hypothetical protein
MAYAPNNPQAYEFKMELEFQHNSNNGHGALKKINFIFKRNRVCAPCGISRTESMRRDAALNYFQPVHHVTLQGAPGSATSLVHQNFTVGR